DLFEHLAVRLGVVWRSQPAVERFASGRLVEGERVGGGGAGLALSGRGQPRRGGAGAFEGGQDAGERRAGGPPRPAAGPRRPTARGARSPGMVPDRGGARRGG